MRNPGVTQDTCLTQVTGWLSGGAGTQTQAPRAPASVLSRALAEQGVLKAAAQADHASVMGGPLITWHPSSLRSYAESNAVFYPHSEHGLRRPHLESLTGCVTTGKSLNVGKPAPTATAGQQQCLQVRRGRGETLSER